MNTSRSRGSGSVHVSVAAGRAPHGAEPAEVALRVIESWRQELAARFRCEAVVDFTLDRNGRPSVWAWLFLPNGVATAFLTEDEQFTVDDLAAELTRSIQRRSDDPDEA